MKWTPNLSVGNSSIDHQHASLFEAIDNFIAACSQKKGNDEVLKTLEFLSKYTAEHFRDEESYLAKNGYPKLAEHKAIHQGFEKYVHEIYTQTKSEGANISTIIDLNVKLNDWLLNHIMKNDMDYAKFIASKK